MCRMDAILQYGLATDIIIRMPLIYGQGSLIFFTFGRAFWLHDKIETDIKQGLESISA